MKDRLWLSVTCRGFRYVRELTDVDLISVRISPRSYREGEKVGSARGLCLGFVAGLLAGVMLMAGQ